MGDRMERLLQQRLPRSPHDAAEAVVDLEEAAVHRDAGDADGGVVEDRTQPALALFCSAQGVAIARRHGGQKGADEEEEADADQIARALGLEGPARLKDEVDGGEGAEERGPHSGGPPVYGGGDRDRENREDKGGAAL